MVCRLCKQHYLARLALAAAGGDDIPQSTPGGERKPRKRAKKATEEADVDHSQLAVLPLHTGALVECGQLCV